MNLHKIIESHQIIFNGISTSETGIKNVAFAPLLSEIMCHLCISIHSLLKKMTMKKLEFKKR